MSRIPRSVRYTVTVAADFRELKFNGPPRSGDYSRPSDELLLLREMHHRFANTLAVLGAVLRCDFARAATADFQRSFARFESLISAFGNLHRCLIAGASNDCTSVRAYFVNLCKALSVAVLEPRDIRCEVNVDAGVLRSERCELLGLVIAELVTNAAKHAFREHIDRLVRIEVIRNADAWLCTVIDNGEGLTAPSPGLGSNIIRQLVGKLGGHLSIKSGKRGTSAVVTCPDCEADCGVGHGRLDSNST
jgi:two-component sensor histidine kinase